MPEVSQSTYIKAAPSAVYETLTTAEGWNAWFTDETSVDLNGEIRLRWKSYGRNGKDIEDGGPVLKAEPGEAFAFQWSPGLVPTTVSFVLEPFREGTLVELRETGYSSADRDVAACVDCAAGWGEALTLLKFYMEHGIVCKDDLM
ncbi:MAG TPA: SRPBCC domain-containing protein [Bacillales bacterium]|jgi:uncharacterized protein YndB with AHSA1/START domain|nr:SRPBCC domain-containing protein [Bacillales bacterium]